MPVAIWREYQTGGPCKPRPDLAGCVLYAPLWRPDMVARGGVIVAGTGTMAETPLGLAVGANTITATGAGTFLISTPVGGTVASGTATITGSPVTLNPGTTTSVTTGVTTGTFTVTTSNIIKSMDLYAASGTVTAATWGYQGRTFNGSSAKINWGAASQFDITGTAISLGGWIYPHGVASGIIVGKANSAAVSPFYQYGIEFNAGKLRFDADYDGTPASKDSTGSVAANVWTMVEVVYDGANVSFYINGALDSAPAKTGNLVTHATWELWYGDFAYGAQFYDGVIGTIWLYNRSRTPSEIMRHYQATKWRYL